MIAFARKSIVFATVIVASFCGCRKTAGPQAPEKLYQAHHESAATPVNFVHKTFTVSNAAKFAFEVPAHSVNPRLQGTFKAYSSGSPENPASIDLLLLTPEQLDDFSRGAGEPAYAVMGTSGQTIDYALSPTVDEPQKYYLVFRNAGKSARSVEADFTASFE